MAVAVFVKGFIFTEGAWAAALRFCGHGRGALGEVCCGDCRSFDLPAQREPKWSKCGNPIRTSPYPIRSLLVPPCPVCSNLQSVQQYQICSYSQPVSPTIPSLFQHGHSSTNAKVRLRGQLEHSAVAVRPATTKHCHSGCCPCCASKWGLVLR
jgi:hypothetical protein